MDFHLTVMLALRWIHIIAGIFWVGFAYFISFVLKPSAAKMDAGTRTQVMPDLLDRAFFWLRWGALASYATGWIYILWKCYVASNAGFHGEDGLGNTTWGRWIAMGVVIGTVLLINTWFVIWPAQKKIIARMKSGQSPDAKLAAHADRVSKINIYLTAPLIFSMGAASHLPTISPWIILGTFVVGFAFVAHLFFISKKLSCRMISLAAIVLLSGGWNAVAHASARGEELYAQHCARCHGDTGSGDGPAHTMQRPWPRDFTTGRYKFRSTPVGTLPLLSDVERVIAKGIPRTSMSGYEKWLSTEEIRLVAEYVMDFSKTSGLPEGSGQAVSVPVGLDEKPALADRLARGKEAFSKNCVTCHGADGRGLGELAGQLRDPHGFWVAPADLTDAQGYGGGSKASDIYRTLTTGIDPSPMPNFGTLLDDRTREDVALYVASLQVEPAQRTLVARADWDRALPAKVRGEYMTRAMSCALCHNAYDSQGEYYPEPYLAGGVAITLPGLGVFPTRNLTSHPEDGLGGWTEEQIARVITTGYAPNRRIEAFSMPWVFFSHLTDGDAHDIAAYVKSLKPIQNKVPERVYQPIWKRIWVRLRQLVGLESGRLEYPPHNAGSRVMQTDERNGADKQ